MMKFCKDKLDDRLRSSRLKEFEKVIKRYNETQSIYERA